MLSVERGGSSRPAPSVSEAAGQPRERRFAVLRVPGHSTGSGEAGCTGRLRRHALRTRDRVPPRWRWALLLFLGSKLVLSVLGVVVLSALDGEPGTSSPGGVRVPDEWPQVSPHGWISMWFAWDSFHYLRMAHPPLTADWPTFAFAPLYPLSGRVVAVALGGHTATALLLVSNLAYLLLLSYAYGLAEQVLGDEAAARRFTTYVVLFPTAFLFQAALTESLFVCLALAAFYHAEQRRWVVVGVLGFLLALTRSIGFVVVVPLALVLLRQHAYRLDRRAVLAYLRTGWPLGLVPAGWLSFMGFARWQTGDWLAYNHAQARGWGITTRNPLWTVWHGVTAESPERNVQVWFAVVVVVLVVASVRVLPMPYVVYTLVVVVVPLSIGPPVYKSLLRYILAAFPVCLLLARWSRNATADAWLAAASGLVQGALFVLWLWSSTGFVI